MKKVVSETTTELKSIWARIVRISLQISRQKSPIFALDMIRQVVHEGSGI